MDQSRRLASSPRVAQTGVDESLRAELAAEQRFVDRVYERLDAAAESARRLAAEGHARARLGNEGGLVERDAIVYQAGRRLASLDAAHDGLVFGRLDLLDDGEPRYIGRLGLRDEHREVLLVDWRAPAAAVFYQATSADPHGVVRRRVLSSRGARIIGIDDDLLDPDHAPESMVVLGDGALLAQLSRARDATMHSVVATIQREQDEVIRSPHRGVTVIEGGPGTGKTVVALHRAAYLLYTDRRRYESGGVLVVGPSQVFMAYIEQVLPSLGETQVSLRSLGDVVSGVSATRRDPAGVAAVKGSARMVTVLSRTVHGELPGAPTSLRLFYRDDVLTLGRGELAQVRRALLAGGQRRNRAAGQVISRLIAVLWDKVRGARALDRGNDEFAHTLRNDRAFVEFAAAWWPVLDPVDVLGWLADRDRLAREAGGLLTAEQIDDVAETLGGEPSVADVALIDELRYLLGEPPVAESEDDPLAELADDLLPELSTVDQRVAGRARPSTSIEDDGYAHVLVDEAQDLSPMQWRMLGRRGRAATWTIVGDAAQSSWSDPGEAATARADALRGKGVSTFRLSTNYRNSREIFTLAAEFARAAIPTADLPVAVRETGVEPTLADIDATELADVVSAAVGDVLDETTGTVAVVVPGSLVSTAEHWLTTVTAAHDGAASRLRLISALDTKGLEFDGLVLVEPDAIVDESPAGVHTLYVVLTRATQRLSVVGTSSRWLDAP